MAVLKSIGSIAKCVDFDEKNKLIEIYLFLTISYLNQEEKHDELKTIFITLHIFNSLKKKHET